MKDRIVFLAASLSQPRIIRRILTLHNAGYSVKVYGYSRGKYEDNKLPTDIEVNVLGSLEDGHGYLSKIKSSFQNISEVIKKENYGNPLFYSFNFMLTSILSRFHVNYIYEISDVLYGYNSFNLLRPFLKWYDKRIISKSECTLVTSQGFADYFFKGGCDKILLQPNKLNKCFLDYERDIHRIDNTESLRFAFVGAIRYPDTILRFAKIIGQKFPQHTFEFYGESNEMTVFKEQLKDYENVHFWGKFKNPQDLAGIYSKVDVVVSCYHTKSLNERIAENNKLYESMFFCKPIVVSVNTFLQNQIKRFKCGYAINAYSDSEIINFINSLTIEELNSIQNNEFAINKEDLIDDANALLEKMSSIVSKS